MFLYVPPRPDHGALKADLISRAYSEDARRLVDYVNNYYLCFCKPIDTDDAFVLTQDAYGAYKGSNTAWVWTSWHFFPPVSPRYMMLLRRRTVLPGKSPRATDVVASWLKDLPVQPAHCDGNGDFDFKHFPIAKTHVQRINSILLDNAVDNKLIMYSTNESLYRTLESFLGIRHQPLKVVCCNVDYWDMIAVKASGEETKKLKNSHNLYDLAYLYSLSLAAREAGRATGLSHSWKPLSWNRAYPSNPTMQSATASPYISLLRLGGFSLEFKARYQRLGQSKFKAYDVPLIFDSGWDATIEAWKADFAQVRDIVEGDHQWEESRRLHSWPGDDRPDHHNSIAALSPCHVWLRGRIWGTFYYATWLGVQN